MNRQPKAGLVTFSVSSLFVLAGLSGIPEAVPYPNQFVPRKANCTENDFRGTPAALLHLPAVPSYLA